MKLCVATLTFACALLPGAAASATTTGISGNPAPPDSPSPSPGPDGFYWFNTDRPSPEASPSPGTTGPITTVIVIPGCTDNSACNYASDATDDDGTCSYAMPNMDCSGSCLPGFPADCLGDCGGSAVCCPATCAAVKGQEAMSCDDVAAAVGTATEETCVTLENNGCDCSGCGCGIVVDDDGYTIPDSMEASGLTCDKTLKVDQPCTANAVCTAHECKMYCTGEDSCEYAAWNTQGGCILYNGCKTTRTVASVTTTYRRVQNGIGMLDSGECACSWWTCVNDNGLGYCPE